MLRVSLGSSMMLQSLTRKSVYFPFWFETGRIERVRQLWMGTHPSLPSTVLDADHKPLSDIIKSQPDELLGAGIRNKFKTDDLPFLFKVLSIGKALSIQAHPDKQLGQQLHQQRPDIYKGA